MRSKNLSDRLRKLLLASLLAAPTTVSDDSQEGASKSGVGRRIALAREAEPLAQIPLKNASFEAGELTVSHWRQNQNVPGVEFVWDRDTASDGEASVSLKKTVKRYFPIAAWEQTVEHNADYDRVRLRAMVRAKNLRKAILDVAFRDEEGKWRHQWAAYIGPKKSDEDAFTHDWKEYVGVVKVPANTKQLIIGLQDYGPGQVWFDEVRADYVGKDIPITLYDEEGNSRASD